MKKFIAVLLAMLLVLVNVAALADGEGVPPMDTGDLGDETVSEATGPHITKKYTTIGTSTTVYPTETLEFEVIPEKDTYPDVTVGTGDKFVVDGSTNEYNIPVNVPTAAEYGEAGMYHYTVQEKIPGNDDRSQAVTYDTTLYNVDVYVFYKIVDNKVTNELDQYIAIYTGEVQTSGKIETKEDEIDNKYEVGELTVTKEIAGNLADPEKSFTIVVKLTSDYRVASALDVKDSTGSVVGATELGATEYIFTATLIGGQNIVIKDIPSGMQYEIEEVYITPIDSGAQMSYVNDPNAYVVDYGSSQTGAIGSTSMAATVTNTKEISIPEGITVEFVPYMVIIALAGIALVALRLRRREEA